MIALESLCLRFQNGQLEVLDQRLLPHQETWISANTTDEMIAAIQSLAIRGAPAIGVAAALSLANSAKQGLSLSQLKTDSAKLRASRPTAVNLMMALDRMDRLLAKSASPEELMAEAVRIFNEDVELCDRIARHGLAIIQKNDGILTHCNTGGLATAGRGTAFGVFHLAHEQGLKVHVYVDETRPLLQGGRLTAWECAKRGIPYTLIADNMAAWEMKQGRVQKVIVGADRIAMNGDFANKIGTYGLAILCKHHGIPFYVAAPRTTLDPECASGQQIPIEQRSPAEVLGVSGSFGKIAWAPTEAQVDNPAFDVTPCELVTGWILDTGLYSIQDIQKGVLRAIATTEVEP